MASTTSTNDAFLTWFTSHGGSIHPALDFTTFPTMGRGAVASHEIRKETILFTLPRSLTLSTRTSCLPSKFGKRLWKQHKLHKGWVGLILCMLWEAAAGKDGKWSGYLDSLPDSFQTPMFWSEPDLQELEGTALAYKIGKTEAEDDYYEMLLPAVKSRPELFPLEIIDSHYSLQKYHIMGSLILSRSFHVDKWSGETGNDIDHGHPLTREARSYDVMEVDPSGNENTFSGENGGEEDRESDSDDDDCEDPADVAMVPMADMLNARYRSENAKLCYHSEDLQMISTRDIAAGEQIWNTYGDPPNSELLRRYGHVDTLPMPGGIEGNPADVVEIRADLVVDVLRKHNADNDFSERIEWWLEEGGDDIFTLETTFVLPGDLISLIRLLTMQTLEWDKIRMKGKIPRPKLDSAILQLADSILEKRVRLYKTSISEDEALLSMGDEIGSNKRMATVVRLGEKRILMGTLDVIRNRLACVRGDGQIKRKDIDDTNGYGYNKKTRF